MYTRVEIRSVSRFEISEISVLRHVSVFFVLTTKKNIYSLTTLQIPEILDFSCRLVREDGKIPRLFLENFRIRHRGEGK